MAGLGGSKDVEWNTSDTEAEDRWRGAVVNTNHDKQQKGTSWLIYLDTFDTLMLCFHFNMRGRRAERDRRERDRRDHDSWDRERHEQHEAPDQRDYRHRRERHQRGRNRSVPPEHPEHPLCGPPRDKELKEPREPREPRPIRTGVEIFPWYEYCRCCVPRKRENHRNPQCWFLGIQNSKYVCFKQTRDA